jgi:hypothetical protein
VSYGLSDYRRAFYEIDRGRSDDYWLNQMQEPPIVPRRDDIRVINPEPPYFWLGREAE